MKEVFCWGIYRGQGFNELSPEAYRTRKQAIDSTERLFGEKWRSIKRKYGLKAVRCLLSCRHCE